MDWQVLTGSRLADAAAGGLIVLAAGSLAAWLCRQPVRRVRLIVLSLLGAITVPALGALPIAPRWSVGLPSAPAAILDRADPAAPAEPGSRLHPARATGSPVAGGPIELPEEIPTGHARTGPALAASGPVASAPAARWLLPSARTVLLGSYFALAAGFAAWWLVGQLLLWRVTRSARPVPSAIRDVFLGLAGPGSGRVVLLESDRIASPFTYTWRRPVILLPATLCDGSEPGALRYVLAHEWSHVEGRDAWTWNLACLAGLVLFYQPLFWWLRRQLRLCQDYLADARAAAAGSAEDYAAFLVRLARVHRSTPAVPALGIGDRRSNLYRRVIMLMQDHEPLERRCRAAWSLSAATAAVVVIVFASGLRLGAAPPAADAPAKGAQAVKDSARPPADAKKAGETLHYKGTVVDKDTGKPIAGATVVVRRMILHELERRVLQETRHTTGADGTYAFEIPPDQSVKPALYIELDVEHPDYAPRNGWGYALSMIRKNEKLNERPFFERFEMRPARPITGRLETPEGRPAAGVLVLAYSRTDKAGGFTEHCFTQAETDAQGRFRLPITTPGEGAYWVKPKDYAPELFVVPKGKRGDMGTITLKKGVSVAGRVLDAQGKPIAGVFVAIERPRGDGPDPQSLEKVLSSVIRRVAETDADGRFTFAPLPPGEYQVKPSETNFDGDRKIQSTRRPLREVFTPTKLTIQEDETPAPLEIRALPTVVIEGRWVDSKGQPGWGFSPLVGGKMDGSSWIAEAHVDPQGRFSVKVPHGLEDATLTIMTNEHITTRYRIGKGGPLVEGMWPRLGTLDHDVKDFEIVRYVAPIIVINATTKDGQQIKDFHADVQYTHPGPNNRKDVGLVGGGNKKEAIQDEQYDGRYRTSNMLPDKEVTVSVSADGFEEASRKLSLPEGKTEELTFVLEPKAPKGAGR
jgi:beta-lactamase regulating signal transducer with metallopeptidase domain/protocatechuate 3,4-dioxygenase beta subunit